jgi:hypothetical protein
MVREEPVPPAAWKQLGRDMNYLPWSKPEIEQFRLVYDYDLEFFATAIMNYVSFILPLKIDGFRPCPTSERGKFWRDKSIAVKNMILSRSTTWAHFRPDSEWNNHVRKTV